MVKMAKATQSQRDKDVIILIALLDKLTSIIVGDIDETDMHKKTFPEIIYNAQRDWKITDKEYNAFVNYMLRIRYILAEIETTVKRTSNLDKRNKNLKEDKSI